MAAESCLEQKGRDQRDRELAELADYRTSDAFSDLDRQVIELAERLTATPADVPESLYSEIRHAIGDDALVELPAEIAWENYRARFNRTFEVQSQGYCEGGFCVLPARPSARRGEACCPRRDRPAFGQGTQGRNLASRTG